VKGAFAFLYTQSLTDEELAWLERFDVVVPGAVLPAEQVARLRGGGSKLFFYEWATGLYADDPDRLAARSWEATVFSKPRWLLNPDQPEAGPDQQGRAYYYDPDAGDFQEAQIARLDRIRRRSAYDGVFFDLVGSLYVPRSPLQVFRARHPRKSYDRALADLFRGLRARGSLVFTNQGYRTPQYSLPISHYDLTESLMTSYVGGQTVRIFVEGEGLVERQETFYRPWAASRPWEEIRSIVGEIQAQVDRYNPAVKILHLNYVNPAYRATDATEVVDGTVHRVYRKEIDRAAIYYGFAAAKLWGHEGYAAGNTVALSQDPVYFTELGKPLGSSYEERDGAVVRYYENGVVVLAASTRAQLVNLDSPLVPPGVVGLEDLYARRAVGGLSVTLEPTRSEASGRLSPAGRVYLYAQ